VISEEENGMKNILFIREIQKGNIGGIEGKIISIATELYRRKLFNPILATSDKKSKLAQAFKDSNFKVYEVKSRGKGGIKKGIDGLEKIVLKEYISLLQSHMFRESLISGWIRKKHPELKHIFRVHTHIEGSSIPKWKKYSYHILDYFNSKYVDCYVPISNVVKDELIKKSGVYCKKIQVVYNGIPAMGKPDFFCNNTFLDKSVAIIGDLQERKQQNLAVEALKLLYSKGITINLHLIGGDRDGYIAKVQTTAQAHGIKHLVHFYGYQNKDKVYKIIKNIPVVILPSLFEGIPTSIIEGMSLRKLVIATPVGGTTELIKDGVNGFLHPPQNPEALADILEKIFTKPAKIWEPMRDAGYRTWKEQFFMEKMMSELIRIYDELGSLE